MFREKIEKSGTDPLFRAPQPSENAQPSRAKKGCLSPIFRFFATAALAACSMAQDRQAIEDRLRQLDDLFQSYQINLRAVRTGEKPSSEELQFVKRVAAGREEANVEFLRTHPQGKDSWGIAPLTDLGSGTYKGEQGGLYRGGKNTPPRTHLQAGLRIARSVVPLNSDGKPDPNGKIVLISIGYSNWTQEFSVFAPQAMADPERNPKTYVLDCALGGQTTSISSHPEAEYYKVVDKRLHDAGISAAQVQVVMLKVATHMPHLPFPWEPNFVREQAVKSVQVLKERFPNLKLLYATSRIYGGYANMALNPEPHAFETGFAVKWLIADQIAAKPELNYDPKKGEVRAPWIAWGPYLWADGMKGRKDGLKWLIDDLRENDRTHPSPQGCEKVSKLIGDFLKSDPTTKTWYVR
jgi:hypothetical protein